MMSLHAQIAEAKKKSIVQGKKYEERYGAVREIYWYVSGDEAGTAKLFTDFGPYDIPLTTLDLKKPIKDLDLRFELLSDSKGTHIRIVDLHYRTFALEYDWILKRGVLVER